MTEEKKKRKPVVTKRDRPVTQAATAAAPEDAFVVVKPVVRGRNLTPQEPVYKIPWAKAVNHPEAGKIIEEKLYALRIFGVDDLKRNKAAVSRIVAAAFNGEVSHLIAYGLSTDHLPKAEDADPSVVEVADEQ